MRLYETTFIINPQTDDATIDSQVRAVTELITAGGGKIVYENRMGTRRMAYPIKKHTQGYYANFIFEGPKTIVTDIDRHMRLGEGYLRHLTVVYEGTVPDKDAPPAEIDMGFGRRGDRHDRHDRGDRSGRPFGRREPGGDRRPRSSDSGADSPVSPVPTTETKAEEPKTEEVKAEVEEKPVVDQSVTPEAESTPEPAPAAETTESEPATVEPEPVEEKPAAPTPAEEPPVEEYREDEEL